MATCTTFSRPSANDNMARAVRAKPALARPLPSSSAADPPGLVELAAALVAGVGGVEQQVRPCRARAAVSIRLGADDQVAGARLEPEPVERRLPQRRLDPLAEIGGDRRARRS